MIFLAANHRKLMFYLAQCDWPITASATTHTICGVEVERGVAAGAGCSGCRDATRVL